MPSYLWFGEEGEDPGYGPVDPPDQDDVDGPPVHDPDDYLRDFPDADDRLYCVHPFTDDLVQIDELSPEELKYVRDNRYPFLRRSLWPFGVAYHLEVPVSVGPGTQFWDSKFILSGDYGLTVLKQATKLSVVGQAFVEDLVVRTNPPLPLLPAIETAIKAGLVRGAP